MPEILHHLLHNLSEISGGSNNEKSIRAGSEWGYQQQAHFPYSGKGPKVSNLCGDLLPTCFVLPPLFFPVIGDTVWGPRVTTQRGKKQSGGNKCCLQSLGKWKVFPEKVRITQVVEESRQTGTLGLGYSVMVSRDNSTAIPGWCPSLVAQPFSWESCFKCCIVKGCNLKEDHHLFNG